MRYQISAPSASSAVIIKRMARGFLIDLDGTLYMAGRLLPGAADAVAFLKSKRHPLLFVTNTTSISHLTLWRKLRTMGLPVSKEEVFNSAMAARLYLERYGRPSAFLLTTPDLHKDFSGAVRLDRKNPRFVVLGDVGDALTFADLNAAFRFIMNGAQLITLADNRYWHDGHGLTLDVGAFAVALEYATGRPALLLGKPSPFFFRLALKKLKLRPSQVTVIGDDLEKDVLGAQALGLTGILVKTGKFLPSDLARGRPRPHHVLESIADLPKYL